VRDARDHAAWEEFFELYAPLIEGYARASGLARIDAEEVRDQCFEVLTRKLPAFEYRPGRGSFQGWLFGIVRGKVVDLLRARRVRARESVELGELASATAAPEEDWERAWRAEHLRHALRVLAGEMTAERYQAFELLLIEELSVAEVAQRTGFQPAQIYKLKAAALRRVREVLARLGTEAG
jgi:RNA polymerase sigma-70 factor (ECF subfamily)